MIALASIVSIWFLWNIIVIALVYCLNSTSANNSRVRVKRRRKVITAWANIAAMVVMLIVAGAVAKTFVIDKKNDKGKESTEVYNYATYMDGTLYDGQGTGDAGIAEYGSDASEDEALSVVNEINPEVEAGYVYVYNVDKDEAVYAKNEDVQISPASTTKLVTALTVLKYCSLDEIVTVGDELDYVADDASRAYLTYGDSMSVYDMLVAMLLPSGNDAAYALAVHTGQNILEQRGAEDAAGIQESLDAFIEEMNNTALEAGASSSCFKSPDGYEAEGQHTTARDMKAIAKTCLQNETIVEIVGSCEVSSCWYCGKEKTYYNTNELIDPDGEYYYSGAIGMKTGYCDNAGACIVSAAEINGNTYICVVMNGSLEGRWEDTLEIYHELEGL